MNLDQRAKYLLQTKQMSLKLDTSDNPLISRWTGCKRGRSGFTGRSGSDAAGFGPDFGISNARFRPVPASPARCGPHADTRPLGGGLA